MPGIVGTWQASEVLKLLLGIGRPLIGRLAVIDALDARMRDFRIERDTDCPVSGTKPTIREVVLIDEGPANEIQSGGAEIGAAELASYLEEHPRARLLDVREPHEAVLGSPEGSIAIPASVLEARMHELDTAGEYVVACRVGARSAWAARRLREAGFGRLVHLRDGLIALAALDRDFEFF